MLGTLLGDGRLDTTPANPRYCSRHGWVQHDYNCRKYRVLSAFVRTPPKKQKNVGYGAWSSYWATVTSPAFSPIASSCYRDGRKTVTRAWLDRLTWEGVAWWYMDDGSRTAYNQLTFHTEGFSATEVETIRDWFSAQGLSAKIQSIPSRHNPDRKLQFVRIDTADAYRLADLIRPYVWPEMTYKLDLPPRAETLTCHWCGTTFDPAGSRRPRYKTSNRRMCCGSVACRAAVQKDYRERVLSAPDRSAKKSAASRSAYAKKTPEQKAAIRARQQAWLAANPEKRREYADRQRAKREARKNSSPPPSSA